MNDLCEFILLRMIRAFQSSRTFIPFDLDKKDIEETRLLASHPTDSGHCAIISFKDQAYLVSIRPIKSTVKVEESEFNIEEFAKKICGFGLRGEK